MQQYKLDNVIGALLGEAARVRALGGSRARSAIYYDL